MKDLLNMAHLTKTELASKLGITPNGVSKWGDDPPRYAVAFLELYIENRDLRELRECLRKVL